jgi:DNA-directed RNA polymerase beta subunit
MERDCLISHGAANFLRDRLYANRYRVLDTDTHRYGEGNCMFVCFFEFACMCFL